VAKVKQQQAEEAAQRHGGSVGPWGLSGCGGAHPACSTHYRSLGQLIGGATLVGGAHSLSAVALGAHPPPEPLGDNAQPPRARYPSHHILPVPFDFIYCKFLASLTAILRVLWLQFPQALISFLRSTPLLPLYSCQIWVLSEN
jgi:hypothetical protein